MLIERGRLIRPLQISSIKNTLRADILSVLYTTDLQSREYLLPDEGRLFHANSFKPVLVKGQMQIAFVSAIDLS